jgi:hypothetical protein
MNAGGKSLQLSEEHSSGNDGFDAESRRLGAAQVYST